MVPRHHLEVLGRRGVGCILSMKGLPRLGADDGTRGALAGNDPRGRQAPSSFGGHRRRTATEKVLEERHDVRQVARSVAVDVTIAAGAVDGA